MSDIQADFEQTFEVADGAAILKQSTSWYLGKLRRGELPGHKAGRRWYLTQSDITEAQKITAQPARAVAPSPVGLTARSRARRRARRS